MSNSPLVTYTNLNRNGHSNGRRASIDTITIHCYVAQVTAKEGCDAFAGRTDASCNYVVGRDGTIGLCVDESNRSWCTGGPYTVNGITGSSNDEHAVTIEVASDVTSPWAVTDAAYKSLVALVADISKRNGLGELKWRADKTLVGKPSLQNMTVHRWFANKACPGDYLYSRLGKIADEANSMLGNPTAYAQLVASLPTGEGSYTKTYIPRLSCPESGNPYYNTIASGGYSPCIKGKPTITGLNVLRNCVGYALGRFNEIGEYGSCKYLKPVNAGQFIANRGSLSYGADPKLGACIVWSSLVGGAGHVGIVEQINADGSIVTSESGWNADSTFWTKKRTVGNGNWGAGAKYHFLGFIYNPAVTDDMVSIGSYTEASYASRPLTWADLGIDSANVHPFIATIPSDMTDIDFNALSNLKVAGLMLFAGQAYASSSYAARTVFRAPNLRKQVESCNKAGFQFALYVPVLSRSTEEAENELNQLYYTVSRYPPGLGLWLQLKFRKGQSKTMNHQILDLYYAKLSAWGLMKGCGLYVTKDELDLIDWDEYKYKYLLWLRDYCESDTDCADIDTDGIINADTFKFDYNRTEAVETVEPDNYEEGV